MNSSAQAIRSVDDILQDKQVIWPASSSSYSVVVFGTLRTAQQKVAIKLWFAGKTTAWLDTEALIYRHVINQLISSEHTPHVVHLIEFVQSDVFNFDKTLCHWNSLDSTKARMLILPDYSAHESLGHWVEERADDDVFAVLFQLVWTLQCFVEVGLTHGDLHCDNIFIEELPSLRTTTYRVGNSLAFGVTTKFMARIFDFDHATKIPTPHNATAHETFPAIRTDLSALCRWMYYDDKKPPPAIGKWMDTFSNAAIIEALCEGFTQFRTTNPQHDLPLCHWHLPSFIHEAACPAT